MLKPWTIVIAAHAITAVLAIALGAFNLIRTVKGDPLHKAVGRAWSGLMLFVSASAFFIGGFTDLIDILLHLLAAWTIISILTGIILAKRGDIKGHRAFMTGSYIGLIGALIGVIVVPTRRIPEWFGAYPVHMTLLATLILATAWLFVFTLTKICTNKKNSNKISTISKQNSTKRL